MQVDEAFESGSLGLAQLMDANTIWISPKRDYNHEGRNWTAIWCYFRVRGAAGRRLRLEFLDLTDEWNHQTSFSWGPRTRPVFSYDNQTWHRFDHCRFEQRRRRLVAELAASRDELWVAYIEPYTLGQLHAFLSATNGLPGVTVTSIGTSAQGRDIPLVTITDPARSAPPPAQARPRYPKRKHVWVVCRQHPWETGSTYAAEGMIRFLINRIRMNKACESPDIQGTYHIIPIANPDGVYLGGTRYNALGYDPNRDYDQATLQTCPETYHLLAALQRAAADGEPPDVLVNVHNNNQEAGEWVSGYGLTARDPRLWAFGHALARHTYFRGSINESSAMTRHNFLPNGHGTAFILEMRTGYVPTLRRYVTKEDQMHYGAGLGQALESYLAEQLEP